MKRNKIAHSQNREHPYDRALNREIIDNSYDWHTLLTVFERRGNHFDAVNWSTFMNRLGKNKKKDIMVLKNDQRYKDAIICLTDYFARSSMNGMSVQAVANITHALAKLEEHVRIILDALEEESEWFISVGKPQEISNVAWAYASLGNPAPKFFNLIDKNAPKIMANGNPQVFSNISWACATLNIPAPNFFNLIERNATKIVSDARVQEISNIAWAFATLTFQAPNFFCVIEKNAQYFISKAKPQEISNTAWAFAKFSIKAPKFFTLINIYAEQIINDAIIQNISNIAWAFATLNDVPGPNLFNYIERHPTIIINDTRPQHIANIAYSYATLNIRAPRLFRMVDETASQNIQKWSVQDISNTAWACGTLDFPAPLFFSAIEDHCPRLLQSETHQTIANTIWAYAELGYDGIRLPKLIDDKSPQLIQNMSPEKVSTISVALAKLGFKCNYFFDVLEGEKDLVQMFEESQVLSNMLWSLSIMDLMTKNRVLLNMLWQKVMLSDYSGYTREQYSQLAQVLLHATACEIELELPEIMQNHIKSAVWCQKGRTSRSENEYSEILEEIGFHHEREVSPFEDERNGNMLRIDYACKKKMIAIEFDGRNHFLTGLKYDELPTDNKENGTTKAKRRFLQRLGWKVINLTYMKDIEMNKRGQNARKVKKEYLREKLRKVGINLSDNRL